MNKELQRLLTAQSDVHGRMARAVTNLKKLGIENITLHAVETRIKLLDQLWAKFEAQHELIRAEYHDSYDESEYSTSLFFDSAENTYVQQRSSLSEYAMKFKAAAPSITSPKEPGHELASKASLPRLKIKPFSGAFEDWPSFRDIFLSIVGDNPSVSNVEKFHHLKYCLEGPAEKLIRPLAVTGDNYPRAWALLSKHFENKKELARSNFATFTAVAKMKSDTADELSRIFNATTCAVNGQESIGRPIGSNGFDLFNHLVVELFDPKTRLEWESVSSNSSDPPEYEALLEFMTKRALTLNAAKPKAKTPGDPPRSAKSHHAKRGNDVTSCVLCKGKHNVMMCEQFKAKSPADRKIVAETQRLCFNCLGSHQIARCQSTKTCSTCKARHHSMLHEAYATKSIEAKPAEASALTAVHRDTNCKATLLATARVDIADLHGELHTARALIDQGSEVSLISEALVQRLRLPRSRSTVSIFGIGGARTGSSRGRVTLNLTSRVNGEELQVLAYVLPRLSSYQGVAAKGNLSWPHIRGLPLADPNFGVNDRIELLLGAEVCSQIFQGGLRRGARDTPIAQKTTLGWILSGSCSGSSAASPRSSLVGTLDHELAALVQRFWEQEKEASTPLALTPDEQACEETFVKTQERKADGRYQVCLPFASPPKSLRETRKSAERLLAAMEKKCRRDPDFGERYSTFLKEYEELGHMREASDQAECYLPHHGVLRESSSSTKLRVVFNGSQRIPSGESLNASLLVGANLLPALADVLMRWRWHHYAIVTDIEKMYRQILVTPGDRRYQRILWRSSTSEPVREFELTTVTYGLACAPFLAIRTLRQLADDEKLRFPRGSIALRRDCYVDDIITGASSRVDAIELQHELRQLCMAGGFPLRKWAANHSEILSGIPPEHRLTTNSHTWEHEEHNTLGLRWLPADDVFAFAIETRTIVTFTKRRVLAETARLFDPLGWLSPVVMRAKILLQSTWLRKLEWDDPLPSPDAQQWRLFFEDLPKLKLIRVTRWLGCDSGRPSLELHGFADASERGYAAVVYLRVTETSTCSVHLLAAKSKVAPLRPVSLPRLELCAASLLTTLVNNTREVLSLSSAPITMWSDSKVTLHWIQGHASRWKTYVANRVAHIQEMLPAAHWRHVPGKQNPADCASRGIAPGELITHPLWWTGPAWLRESADSWPAENESLPDSEVPELRTNSHVAVARPLEEPELLLKFSALHLLLRVTAWCLRWRHPRNRTPEQVLTSKEINEALTYWLRMVQSLHYSSEVAAVACRRPLPRQSNLSALTPFADEDGVLRVGGRLKHAVLSFDERHPRIIPPQSRLTRLLVVSIHRRTLHGGIQLTLGTLRERFWLPRGRAVVKHCLHRCVTCTRWKAASPQPPMGNLPRSRVTPARPFLRSGIDYAGPVFIRTGKGRGHRAHKAFIALFVCLSSRAVHIEAVSDYTAEAFLAALRRFTSRRGLCADIYSDCGTNFIGADRQLKELLRASSPSGQRIAHAVIDEGIQWHFNPPSAPHFGGLWEAAVKSTKHHLRRVIGDTTLTFEEISTLLAQVEACLNSRPLRALSDDPDDLSALTPGHLLIGAPLVAIPEPSLSERTDNSLSRWQLLQKMRDHFWMRWSREYLHSAATRPKWHSEATSPRIGSLCLLRSEITPPSKWPLARIIKLHPGDDGVTRVVTVRTATSELVRPLIKMVLLPADDDAPTPHGDA